MDIFCLNQHAGDGLDCASLKSNLIRLAFNLLGVLALVLNLMALWFPKP